MFLILCLCYVILCFVPVSFPICHAYSFFHPRSRSYSFSHSCFFSLYRFLSCPLIPSNWCSVSSFRALFIPLPFCAFIFFRAPFYILSFFLYLAPFVPFFILLFVPLFSIVFCVVLGFCSCLYIILHGVAIGRSIAGCYCLI